MHRIWMSNLPKLLEVAAKYNVNITVDSKSAYKDCDGDWVITVGTDTLNGADDMNIWFEYDQIREL